MSFELIIAVLSGVYALAIYVLRRHRGNPISSHPYRDPFGDAQAASRPSPSPRESLRRAPGTR